MNEKLSQQLRPLVLKAMDEKGGYITALDHLRYEALRIIDPQDFVSMWQDADNLDHFDELVDQLILSRSL